MINIDRKPNGYSFADFKGSKCFQTIRFIQDNNDYVKVARNGGEAAVFYFVSENFYNYAESTLGMAFPAQTLMAVTDDYLSQNVSKLVELITGKAEVPQNLGYIIAGGLTNSSALTLRIENTKPYTTDGVNEVAPLVRGYILEKSHFEQILGALP